jgi:LAS superfamily LD-carboxypeptidase LdcB
MNTPDYETELRGLREANQVQAARIQELEAEIAQLKTLLSGKAEAKAAKNPRFTDNYSFSKNRQKKKRRKNSTGRRSNDAKCALIEEESPVYPENVVRSRCILHRTQCAWRIVDGTRHLLSTARIKPLRYRQNDRWVSGIRILTG